MESHLRMLEQLSERTGGDPVIGLLVTEVRLGLTRDECARTKLRAAIPESLDDTRLPARLKLELARWIADDVNPYPSDANSTGESPGRLDPSAHAQVVIRALESRCEAIGVGPSLLPAAAFHMAGITANRGAEQRKAGRLDDACHTAACLSAFARTLVGRNPDEAAFHQVLSMAFVQESKNAWRIPDHTTIEDRLRKALSEAYIALRLDPHDAGARINVAILQDKLVALVSRPATTR
jgi:hypothetical protein